MKIPFNKPYTTGMDFRYIDIIRMAILRGDYIK